MSDSPAAQFLEELVHDAIGQDIEPRSGQLALTQDIEAHAELAGEAPTGVGKSFAALSNAATWAASGERTLISTESLSLLSQIVAKDAPAAQQTDLRLNEGERSFDLAVLKGWSNYVCLARAITAAHEAAGDQFAGHPDPSDIPSLTESLRALPPTTTVEVDGTAYTAGEITPLLQWALDETVGHTGDRAQYPGALPENLFRQVSIDSDECSRDKCPLWDLCYARKAREQVEQADVIVTNHSVLAVQAAQAVPVVLGNSKIRQIHHVIVDEAHALPGIVRNQGQQEVSSRRVRSLMRSAKRLLAVGSGKRVDDWFTAGAALSKALDSTITGILRTNREDGRLGVNDRPFTDDFRERAEAWAGQLIELITPLEKIAQAGHDLKGVQSGKHIHSAVTRFLQAIAQVAEHTPGVARWVELSQQRDGSELPVLQSAPVNVGALIRANLWEAEGGPEDEPIHPVDSVAVISGTLPQNIGSQLGLDADWRDYASPFDDAYENSLLYVPKFSADRAEQIAEKSRYGKWKFSTTKHRDTALADAVRLVGACSGGALVLSANSSNGREYARALRSAFPDRTILDQWSGVGVQELVRQWREDVSAVLVGTKSMMTGVDGQGRTCELVIIDRPARAARNPVDEARLQLISDQTGDRWGADREVYVGDAAILLEQALGRLIRSASDVGVAAVLDCRLTKTSVVSYPTLTREKYMHAARRFTQKTTNIERAIERLHALGETVADRAA
ncbi:ATP-dependent DNA helicase [Pseudoclavibacter soli]|uniref:ATP-dependent DNA helicase n=1 Tax=Pseudoclavibacter soli TaxID=452623 RepID=UPI00041E0043|nr:ATP-dependent DNA helicase [Pseudoclavibacter soli]